jgi:hypothetical protein
MAQATHWAFDFWLVFSSSGRVRQTVREPDVSRDERKMFVHAALPKSLWHSPSLRATITVTDDNHEPKFELDLTAAGDALRSALGVDIDMRVVPFVSDPVEQAEEQVTELIKGPDQ